MKNTRLKVLILALVLAFQISPSTSSADQQIQLDAWSTFSKTEQANSIGVLFDENVSNGASIGWQNGANQKRILGLCSSGSSDAIPSDVGCVIGASIVGSDGTQTSLTPLGEINGTAGAIPENTSSNLPASRSPILFKDGSGNLYLLRAGDWVFTDGGSTNQTLSVDLAEVTKVADSSLSTPTVTGAGSSLMVIPSPADCYGVSQGICYKTLTMPPSQAFEVKLKAPASIKGWFRTRIAQVKATVTSSGVNGEIIDIQGAALKVPVIGGWIPYAQLSKATFQSLESFYTVPSTDPQGSFQFIDDRVNRSDGFSDYLNLYPYLPTKALLTRYEWGFDLNALDNSTSNPCLTAATGISGIVSTNGGIFDGGPPAWNASTHTLDYQVAAPHSDESGNDLEGDYELRIPNALIKCLYGTAGFPAEATISVAGEDSSSYVATSVLGNEDGWSSFQVSGFHYSNPKIEITFADPKPAASSSPTPSPTPRVTSVARSAPVSKKLNYCIKGKQTTALKAGVTKCSKGWTLVQR